MEDEQLDLLRTSKLVSSNGSNIRAELMRIFSGRDHAPDAAPDAASDTSNTSGTGTLIAPVAAAAAPAAAPAAAAAAAVATAAPAVAATVAPAAPAPPAPVAAVGPPLAVPSSSATHVAPIRRPPRPGVSAARAITEHTELRNLCERIAAKVESLEQQQHAFLTQNQHPPVGDARDEPSGGAARHGAQSPVLRVSRTTKPRTVVAAAAARPRDAHAATRLRERERELMRLRDVR